MALLLNVGEEKTYCAQVSGKYEVSGKKKAPPGADQKAVAKIRKV